MSESSNADTLLRQHAATAAAMSILLHPHAEVVLHDLETGLIAGIWNAFSGRKPGMASLVEGEVEEAGEGGVYDIFNFHACSFQLIANHIRCRPIFVLPCSLADINN